MTTDTLRRRLRTAAPQPRVKRLALTDADLAIFAALDRHGLLPSPYLYEFSKHLRTDWSHLQNRLTEFYNGDAGGPFLLRPPQQFATFAARYQHLVYDLAPRAKIALAEQGMLSRCPPERTAPFVHRLMTACAAASFELCAPRHGLCYIGREKILERAGSMSQEARNSLAIPLPGSARGTLIPDELFGLEYPGDGFRFFALEIDRNTESIERRNLRQRAFGWKVEGYAGALNARTYRAHWDVPNLHVLTVTTSATHARNLLRYIAGRVPQALQSRFAVTCVPRFGADWRVPDGVFEALLNDPWMTTRGEKCLNVGQVG